MAGEPAISSGCGVTRIAIVTRDPRNSKTAKTDYPIDPLLADRWSPRGFDTEHELTGDELGTLLEAARWTPSAANSQPWRFIVARRGTASFASIADALTDNNRLWAPQASVLLVVCARTQTDDGHPMRWAQYDTGQAAAHLTIQAELLGLSVHQMGGFHPDEIRRSFSLPEEVEPLAVIAVGHFDEDADLPEALAEREVAPRERVLLDDLLLNDWTD